MTFGRASAAASRRRGLALPFPLLLALRYLRSTRRDAFVSFLSAVAAGGIALGVAALVLALAALSGFQTALKREVLARTAEIEVELPRGADAAAVRSRLEGIAGVAAAQVLARGQGWLLSAGRVRPVEVVGFERTLPRAFPGAPAPASGLHVSDRLAAAWGLTAGDRLEVASNRPTLTPLGPQPRVRRLPLAGTFTAGRTETTERVALPLAAAEGLLGPGERRLEVATGGLERAAEVAARLAPALPPGSAVRTWRELNRPLLFALRLEKTVMFAAVSLIVVVASLALVSDLMLIIATKRPEIGMLGALGAGVGSLRGAFVALGGLLAAAGGASGLAAGVAGAWLLDRFRVLSLPGQVYFLDYVPFRVRLADLAGVVAVTFGLALASALRAAARAAALAPVEALRR